MLDGAANRVEVPAGGGLTQKKWSASGRYQSKVLYGLAEYAHTQEIESGRDAFAFRSVLAEGSVTRNLFSIAARIEQTDRAEEERTSNLFRTQRPPSDLSILGRTRWTIATVNATGKVIIPGLINTHTHVPMSLFRGISDDLDLNDWLTKYIFPAEAKNVTEAFVRAGTRLGLAEMIRGGTTTYCDMYYFEDAVADESKKAGMRGVLGETVIDFPVADNKTHEQAMAYADGVRIITPSITAWPPTIRSRSSENNPCMNFNFRRVDLLFITSD